MSKQTESSLDSASIALMLKVFEERGKQSVKDEEDMDFHAQQEMEKTQRIRRFSLYLAFGLTPLICILIATLVFDMGKITNNMQKMQGNISQMQNDFEHVTTLVGNMDSSVSQISQKMAVMPQMHTDVAGMEGNFQQMTTAMRGITPNVGEINRLLAYMERDMAQMDALFGHLNYSVLFMGKNVDTLSGPMKVMKPFFGR